MTLSKNLLGRSQLQGVRFLGNRQTSQTYNKKTNTEILACGKLENQNSDKMFVNKQTKLRLLQTGKTHKQPPGSQTRHTEWLEFIWINLTILLTKRPTLFYTSHTIAPVTEAPSLCLMSQWKKKAYLFSTAHHWHMIRPNDWRRLQCKQCKNAFKSKERALNQKKEACRPHCSFMSITNRWCWKDPRLIQCGTAQISRLTQSKLTLTDKRHR